MKAFNSKITRGYKIGIWEVTYNFCLDQHMWQHEFYNVVYHRHVLNRKRSKYHTQPIWIIVITMELRTIQTIVHMDYSPYLHRPYEPHGAYKLLESSRVLDGP